MTKKLIRRALPAVIEDLKYWQLQSDKKYQRIKTIIEQLCVNPKYLYLWRARYHYVDIPKLSSKNDAIDLE